jgi:hypothetical protein
MEGSFAHKFARRGGRYGYQWAMFKIDVLPEGVQRQKAKLQNFEQVLQFLQSGYFL